MVGKKVSKSIQLFKSKFIHLTISGPFYLGFAIIHTSTIRKCAVSLCVSQVQVRYNCLCIWLIKHSLVNHCWAIVTLQ